MFSVKDNVIEWFKEEEKATIHVTDKYFIRKVKKMAEKNPSEIKIISEENGCLIAHVPVSFLNIKSEHPELRL